MGKVMSDKAEQRSAVPTGPVVQFRAIGDLQLYERNARTHSDEQVQQLMEAMTEFGWTVPVMVDAKGVVAGHARIAAAQRFYNEGRGTLAFPNGSLIPAGMVPVLDCEGWSSERRRAYIIADNKLALNAGWDVPMLIDEITSLLAADFDLNLVGFNDAELGQLLAPEPPAGGGGASAHWGGMPEYQNKDKTAFRSILIHFSDQEGVDNFAALLQQNVTPLTKYLWVPALELEIVENKAWK